MKRLIVMSLIAFVVMSLLTSCCTSQKVGKRKIARIVNCNPSLINDLRDTVTIRITDTIVTKPISGAFAGVLTGNDTFTHVDSNGIVTRIVRLPNDTITQIDTIGNPNVVRVPFYLETICPPDTVFIDLVRTVPCPDPIVVADVDPIRERAMKIQWFGFGVGIGALLLLVFVWLVGKLRN